MFGYMKNSSKNNISIIQKFIELENTLLIMNYERKKGIDSTNNNLTMGKCINNFRSEGTRGTQYT